MSFELRTQDVHIVYDEHGNKVNPRGRLVNTAELEASIQAEGQTEPALVYEDKGVTYLLNGERRLNVCKKSGINILCINYTGIYKDDMNLTNILKIMLTTNVRKELPMLTLDSSEEANIIGGIAMSVKQLASQGVVPINMADLVGLKYNVILGLQALFVAHPSVRKAVAAETLGVSNVSGVLKPLTAEQQGIVLEFARKRGAKVPYSRENLKATVKWLKENNWGQEVDPTADEPEPLSDTSDSEGDDLPDSPRDKLEQARRMLNNAVLSDGLTSIDIINLNTIVKLAEGAIERINRVNYPRVKVIEHDSF